MNKDEEYRCQAEHAEHEARRAINQIDREAWLKVAEGWRGLMKPPQREDDRESK